MKKQLLIFGLIMALGIGAFCLWRHLNTDINLSFTQDELQQILDRQFPLTKEKLLFSVLVYQPELHLIENSDRIAIDSVVEVRLFKQRAIIGELSLEGGLGYQKELSELYIADPRINALDINGLPEELTDPIKQLVLSLIDDYLNYIPLYRLEQADYSTPLGQFSLESVTVSNNTLNVHLKRSQASDPKPSPAGPTLPAEDTNLNVTIQQPTMILVRSTEDD